MSPEPMAKALSTDHNKAARSALVTVRRGDSVTAIHCPILAARWVDALLEQSKPAGDGSSLMQRLKVVEDSLRLQMSLGASHLQQVEKAPEEYGLPSSVRAPVRALRRRRNKALHGMGDMTDDAATNQDALNPKYHDVRSSKPAGWRAN